MGKTGLAALIWGGADGPRMSLPEAMIALERGEIARPPDSGALGTLTWPDEGLPPRPAPAPKRLAYQDELDAQKAQDDLDRAEMLARSRIRMERKNA